LIQSGYKGKSETWVFAFLEPPRYYSAHKFQLLIPGFRITSQNPTQLPSKISWRKIFGAIFFAPGKLRQNLSHFFCPNLKWDKIFGTGYDLCDRRFIAP
jgi:hypothetical protein